MISRSYVSLSSEQAVRKTALVLLTLAGLFGFAFTQAFVFGRDTHKLVEDIGLALLIVYILGRVWCSLYIGGHKIRELITNGPYSVVRNPLYVFSFIGAAGVGAQSGSVTLTVLFLVAAIVVFSILVRREEKVLLEVHGEGYAAYLKSTPRFIPNPGLWWDRPSLDVVPTRVARTFADGLVFLLAIPIAEGLEFLQRAHILPVLANLP
jgi:protein-S-isoprenylcysteine O-methyltransferase Ste14